MYIADTFAYNVNKLRLLLAYIEQMIENWYKLDLSYDLYRCE